MPHFGTQLDESLDFELLGMELAHLPDGTPTRRVTGLDTNERTLAEALGEAGTTPWPKAPKDGKIIYTGDGR